jgi:type II secretory pathway predicted ATPase ExeA
LSTEPPYKPGYGLEPPLLVGRDRLLAWTWEALVSGPTHPDFHQALLGERGVGKTVVAQLIASRAKAQLGWAVLDYHAIAGEASLPALVHELPGALGAWSRRGREFRQLEKQLSVGVNIGVLSASTTLRSTKEGLAVTTAFGSLVRDVGRYARSHETGLLVTIDEAHVLERQPDLAALSRSMQTIVKERLPIAVLLVGLPPLRERFNGAGTFIQRLQTRQIGDLSPESARLALVEPAARVGVHFEPEALDALVDRSNGRPYHVQLFGYHAWRAADGATEITRAHVEAGLQEAYVQLDGEFEPTWHALRPQDRDYLVALSEIGPYEASTEAVAHKLGRAQRQLSMVRDRLVNEHGVLYAPARGVVQFSVQQFGDWVGQRHGRSTSARDSSLSNLLEASFPTGNEPGEPPKHPDARTRRPGLSDEHEKGFGR